MTHARTAPAPAARPHALHRATIALEQATALDPAVGGLTAAADALVGSPGRRDALQGHWLGHALHPLLVMVPLGSWASVGVLDVVGGPASRPAAQTLTGFGVLAAVPSVVTGLAELADASPRDRRTATVHAAVNSVALVLHVRS